MLANNFNHNVSLLLALPILNPTVKNIYLLLLLLSLNINNMTFRKRAYQNT